MSEEIRNDTVSTKKTKNYDGGSDSGVSQGEDKGLLSTNRSKTTLKPLTPTKKGSTAQQRLKLDDETIGNMQGGSKFKPGMSKLAKKDDTVDIT